MNAPVSENGAQCLGMCEQMFMTLRDQGEPLVITDALKQKVKRIIRENRHFTISEVYEQSPEVSLRVLYEIFTEHLQYRKICARCVPWRSGGHLVRGGNK